MYDNMKYVAAILHLKHVSDIFRGEKNEISETLTQLANFIIDEYKISDE
jgi:hypothetical protein